jgi:hemerythrin-like domain-containing protein
MAVQIGAKLDSGFDDPLGMLKDCHRRIERFLGILCVVAARASDDALNQEERGAVQAALEYFRVGGERHTQDEEKSLFPRLQGVVCADDSGAIGDLEAEHREAEELHAAVDRLFFSWIGSGSLSRGDRQVLLGATERLKSLYAEHIQIEETIVFPHAAAVLDREAIAAMGSEFRARRAQASH